jgi:hypothetical protein
MTDNKIKAVRLMCDNEAEVVWDVPRIPNSTMDGFRVSDALWDRIQRWQRWHDSQDPLLEPFDPNFDTAGFSAEGDGIARTVKAELPEWRVFYHDEALWRRGVKQGDNSIETVIEIT